MDDLRNREDEIVTLKRKVKNTQRESQRHNDHSEMLKEKETTIFDLQERLEKTLALNNRLDQSVKKHEETVKNMEKSFHEVELHLEKSTSESNTKDRTIERNNIKVNELQEQLDAKNEEITEIKKRYLLHFDSLNWLFLITLKCFIYGH